MHFSQLRKLRGLDLDFDLRSGRGHTGAHIWSGLPTHEIRWKSEKKLLWTYGRTGGRTDTPQFQSTRSSVGDDLIINAELIILLSGSFRNV